MIPIPSTKCARLFHLNACMAPLSRARGRISISRSSLAADFPSMPRQFFCSLARAYSIYGITSFLVIRMRSFLCPGTEEKRVRGRGGELSIESSEHHPIYPQPHFEQRCRFILEGECRPQLNTHSFTAQFDDCKYTFSSTSSTLRPNTITYSIITGLPSTSGMGWTSSGKGALC
ncbi:hypothetical protein F5X97DRAFT_304614 [Nemania serpens]|nr:hypothetical protein F5X97DRAFT_304614 [Nemania serpens]